jgi:uncharacterized DUF497 family protein
LTLYALKRILLPRGDVVDGDLEWDHAKAIANEAKHGVAFTEAAAAYIDPNAVDLVDATYADRMVTIGMSNRARVLFVVTTAPGERTRIISA